ncbi:Dihaem cytochrome c [Flavobacterium fluvii]|uniref:Dihaem cytochrome c n=1 Tax=Flavobacterium fluvii TaxID=468056 RepID=A0A1M5NIS3_9FLAO|nr:cytochrome c [Flavobacterium fluvii]SHG89109.1 Dihaem cytochrome c [Flavobacterium fluvii]
MKIKLIFLAATAVFIASCSSKKTVVAADVPKEGSISPELVQHGKNLYVNNCVKCHALYEPKKFSQEKWKPILVKMQKKARLDDVQIAAISNYITSQL